MGRNKGSVKLVLLGKPFGTYSAITEEGWRNLEKIVDKKLPRQTRNRIDEVNEIYSILGPIHATNNTLPLRQVRSRIESCIDATTDLRSTLRLPEAAISTRAE